MTEDSHASAVFDCMVFLQAAVRREGPAGACLALAEAGVIKLYISRAILAEVRDVLTRPVLRRKFSVLNDGFVDEFITAIRAMSIYFQEVPEVVHYARDP